MLQRRHQLVDASFLGQFVGDALPVHGVAVDFARRVPQAGDLDITGAGAGLDLSLIRMIPGVGGAAELERLIGEQEVQAGSDHFRGPE